MKIVKAWHFPPRRVVLWHAVAAFPLTMVVALGGYLSYHYHALSIQSREQVDRAYEVLDRVGALFVAVEDADIAERDFIITGDDADLSRIRGALDATARARQRLHDLLLQTPEQLGQLDQLDASIAAEFTDLGQTIALRRAQGFDAARSVIAQRGGTRPIDRVRVQAHALAATEHRLLMQRQELARSHERSILLVGVIIAALSVATRLLIAWFLASLRKRGRPSPFMSRDRLV